MNKFKIFSLTISFLSSAMGFLSNQEDCGASLFQNKKMSPVIKSQIINGDYFENILFDSFQRAETNPEEFPLIESDRKKNIFYKKQKEIPECSNCEIVYAYTRHDLDFFGFVNGFLNCAKSSYIFLNSTGKRFVESFKNKFNGVLNDTNRNECISGVKNSKTRLLFRSQWKTLDFQFINGIWTNYMFLSTSDSLEGGALQYYAKNDKYLLVFKINENTKAKQLLCSAYPEEKEVVIGLNQKWRKDDDDDNEGIKSFIANKFQIINKEFNMEDIIVLTNLN